MTTARVYRRVQVWCDQPDHSRFDHSLTEECIAPRTFDLGGPPDVTVLPSSDMDSRAQGPTWAEGVFQ